MNADFLRAKFEAGQSYADYVAAGNPQQQGNWQRIYEQAKVTPAQQQVLGGFNRQMHVIGLSGVWCGDCVQQCPLTQRIAEANPDKIALRWLDRDAHAELQDMVKINTGRRVPVLIFAAEDFEFVAWYGDRTLSRYRALAARQLGGACPLPGAPVDADELAATLQDWCDQFERAHLILRLSARLRQKHGD